MRVKSHFRNWSIVDKIPRCSACKQHLLYNEAYQNLCESCESKIEAKCYAKGFEEARAKNYFLCQSCSSSSTQCLECTANNNAEKSPICNSKLLHTQLYCSEHQDTVATYFTRDSLITLCTDCNNSFIEQVAVRDDDFKRNLVYPQAIAPADPSSNYLSSTGALVTKSQLLNEHEYMQYTGRSIQDIYDSYPYLDKYFKDFYVENFKILSPERRKSLFTSTTQDLLEACRWILELNRPNCHIHRGTPAEFVNNQIQCCCSKCARNLDFKLQIYPTSSKDCIMMVKDLCKATPSTYLTKFLLQQCRNSYSHSNNKYFFNLLLLEVRDFIEKRHEVELKRCVNCLVKLTKGSQTGLLNKCNHCICYACSRIEDLDTCPLCRAPIEDLTYDNIKYTRLIPECHSGHSLHNHPEVYRLPCKHYSCKACLKQCTCLNECNCLNISTCLKCFYTFTMFGSTSEKGLKVKFDNKASRIVEFCSVICKRHEYEEYCSYFSIDLRRFFCGSCEVKGRSIPNSMEFNSAMELIDHCFSCIVSTIAISARHISLLGQANYYNLLSCQDKSELLEKLEIVSNSSLNIPSNYQVIERFENLFPNHFKSKSIWEIKENNISGITLSVTEDSLLTGLCFLGRYLDITTLPTPIMFSITSLQIIKRDKSNPGSDRVTIYNSEAISSYRGKTNRIFFSKPVYLSPDFIYEIILKCSPGKYFNGVPYTLKSHNLFKISSLKTPSGASKSIGNEAIGGPISGLIISDLSSFLNSKNP